MKYTIKASVNPYDDTYFIACCKRTIAFKVGDIVEIKYPDRTITYIAVRDIHGCDGCAVSKTNSKDGRKCSIRVPHNNERDSCLCANSAVNLSLQTAGSILENL